MTTTNLALRTGRTKAMQTIQKKDSMERFFEDVQAALARNYAHQQSEKMVKRGVKSRILQGYLPARAPRGL